MKGTSLLFEKRQGQAVKTCSLRGTGCHSVCSALFHPGRGSASVLGDPAQGVWV